MNLKCDFSSRKHKMDSRYFKHTLTVGVKSSNESTKNTIITAIRERQPRPKRIKQRDAEPKQQYPLDRLDLMPSSLVSNNIVYSRPELVTGSVIDAQVMNTCQDIMVNSFSDEAMRYHRLEFHECAASCSYSNIIEATTITTTNNNNNDNNNNNKQFPMSNKCQSNFINAANISSCSRCILLARKRVSNNRSKAAIFVMTIIILGYLIAASFSSYVLVSCQYHPDPRPTIYSGDVSFGLLLSSHSSATSELSLLASSVPVQFASPPSSTMATTIVDSSSFLTPNSSSTSVTRNENTHTKSPFEAMIIPSDHNGLANIENQNMKPYEHILESRMRTLYNNNNNNNNNNPSHQHEKRQIFEKISSMNDGSGSSSLSSPASSMLSSGGGGSGGGRNNNRGFCSVVDTDSLYSGMAAIWSSHQANLMGDSYLNIGAYVYDSCSDLDVGQRQSVRIVSNLNAFQQTTCESPRGSPISVTIAHGDQQTKAIQLLTSFKVPVITTKENFAIEDYNTFTSEQKRYLFTTAPSSRFLAHGALKFSKKIVQKSSSSPLLANHDHKLSSMNGLIIISSNLPAILISYLQETIPNFVNYEMLQSSQPIDQIKSIESLESILTSRQSSSSSSSARKKRNSDSNSNNGDDGGDQTTSYSSSNSSSDQTTTTMLSPTILLFITPAEAIDLVTRLRNDLAQVSKYYSLIVITREDITKALKTIFNRGGSSLCSGKSFYTISPRPEDTGEFSRYFRDTVQLEGETSDHPLICEFAKYQSTTKVQVDPDEMSAEPVIKAVWVAASALKLIHNRECKSSSSGSSSGSGGFSGSSTKANQNQCLMKLNRNLTQLVYKSMKRLDTVINSTGLNSLDGFRLKFDQENELVTNKYSIKYISNDCDITEVGQYTAIHGGQLSLDEDALRRSYEATLPQPWPTASSNRRDTAYKGGVVIPFERLAEASEESVNNNDNKNNNNNNGNDSGGDETDGGEESEEDLTTTRRPVNQAASSDNYDQSNGSNIVLHKKKISKNINNNNNNNKQTADKKKDSTVSVRSKPVLQSLAALNDYDRSAASTTSNRMQKLHQHVAGALIDFIDGKRVHPSQSNSKMVTESPIRSGPHEISSNNRNWSGSQHSYLGPLGIRVFNEEQIDPASRDVPTGGTNLQNNLDSNNFSTNHPTTLTTVISSGRSRNDDGDDLRAKATTEAPYLISLPPMTTTTIAIDDEVSDEKRNGSNAKQENRRQQNARSTKSILSEDDSKLAINSNNHRPSDSMYNGHTFGGGNYLLNGRDHTTTNSDRASDSHTTSSANIFNPLGNVPGPFNELEPSPASSMSPVNGVGDVPSSLPINILGSAGDLNMDQSSTTSKVKIRQHVKWIYTSWIALSILSANIIGALITLYVLTFLLMKNCEGSLDRDNQSLRSIHLLAIIVVFFGSTLFVIYPTPALCLFRTSWHNFALVLLFGTLLLRAMQTRAQASIGLGGRQDRLNQFVTLIFLVLVQVALEVQRWRYETKSVGSEFLMQIPLTIHNQQRRSSSIQPQNILKAPSTRSLPQMEPTYVNVDYCLSNADDFLHSQLYVCLVIIFLILYSFTTRREVSYRSHHCHNHHHHHMNAMASSVHLVTGGPTSGVQSSGNYYLDGGNSFIATIICVPVYSFSIILHVYVQNGSMRDVICSITMILIAFSVLIGIFAPIMIQIHRYGKLVSLRNTSSIDGAARSGDQGPKSSSIHTGSSSTVFSMFPELASDQQNKKHPQRRNGFNGGCFSETKQSRNNMGAALAKLGPSSADALRNMGYINGQGNSNNNNDEDGSNSNLCDQRHSHHLMDNTGNYLLTVHSNDSGSSPKNIATTTTTATNSHQHSSSHGGDSDVTVMSPSVASSGSSSQPQHLHHHHHHNQQQQQQHHQHQQQQQKHHHHHHNHNNMDQGNLIPVHHQKQHRSNNIKQQQVNNGQHQKQQASQLIRNHQIKVQNQTAKLTSNTTAAKTKAPNAPQQQGYRSYFYPLNPDGSPADMGANNFRNSQFEEQGYRCAYP